MQDIQHQFWNYLEDDTLEVIHPETLKKVKYLLSMSQFQETSKKDMQIIEKFQEPLFLLDWIQCRQEGISVVLTPEQEKIVQSFLSFKQLKQQPLPKKLKELPREYQKESMNWLCFGTIIN